jgi:hypothetical protein
MDSLRNSMWTVVALIVVYAAEVEAKEMSAHDIQSNWLFLSHSVHRIASDDPAECH